MLYHLLIAGLGVAGLLGLWLGVQALGRRQSADPCDGPEMMTCGACAPEHPQCSIERGAAEWPERANHCSMKTVETDAEQV